MSVMVDELVGALDRVAPAVSRDPKQPILRCVLVRLGDRRLRLVATDRHRLAISELRVEGGDAAPVEALIAAGDLDCIRGIEPGALVTLDLDGQALRVRTGADTHTVPVVPGEFPSYERFLAADADAGRAVVDRTAFLAAIEAVADDEPLQLRLTDGALELGAVSPVRLDADRSGDGVTVLLNPDFAHQAATAVRGPRLVVEASSPVSPVVLRSASDDRYTCVVMPVRVSEPRPRRKGSTPGT